eukprot:GEMP01059553.1.p1 GENE.GEMP01059553.1~~GEMP01059553.1.p1  ORF type:complete len:344 (+),score=50.46 GEMP01059553.1:106-1137(+)
MHALRALAGGFPALCQPAWSESLGIEAAKVDTATSRSKGNGLVATENVEKNEAIVRVPFRSILEAPDNLHTTLGEKLLASQKHELYRQILPEKFHLPQSMDVLEGTAIAGAQIHARELNRIRPVGVPRSRWQWALDVVSTRSGLFGADECLSLVPLVCFANHSPTPNAQVQRAQETVDLVATQNIAAGEEVYISYGDLSTEQLLFSYGFFDGKLSIVCPFLEFSESERASGLQQLICLDSGAIGPLLEYGAEELKVWIAIAQLDEAGLKRVISKLNDQNHLTVVEIVRHDIRDDKVGPVLRELLGEWKHALEKLRERKFPGAVGEYIEESLHLVSSELNKIRY